MPSLALSTQRHDCASESMDVDPPYMMQTFFILTDVYRLMAEPCRSAAGSHGPNDC